MPGSSNPGTFLRAGEFYSAVESRRRTENALLSELRQPCSRMVPRHEHELAYVTIVLHGDYVEGDHGRLEELQPFTAVFNPAGATHRTVIGPAGASFFTVELRGHNLQEWDLRLPQHTWMDRGAGALLWPGLRLYSDLKQSIAEELVLEAHLMEMLAAIAGWQTAEKTAPRWLGRVKEQLHEDFRNNLRIRDLASDAGVHPVHLARVFRMHERQTPGDYLQRLRVRAACSLLRNPEWPLASVAAECGFADQSHLTRVFGRLVGSTPARFRRSLSAQP
jgi:AraC family transcriptional regulator